MIRRIVLTMMLLLSLTALLFSQGVKYTKVERSANDGPNLVGFVPNAIVVKFDDSILSSINKSTLFRGKTGIFVLDQLGQRLDVGKIIQKYPHAEKRRYKGRIINLQAWHKIIFAGKVNIEDAVRAYKSLSGVIDAQPIGIHKVYNDPNDSKYPDQWHLNQANDHDIDAPEAWDIETGDDGIIVAILDTGVRYFHKDLGGSNASYSDPTNVNGNMWINWAEKNGVAGVDDDGNGYIDDWVGWDFVDGETVYSGEDGDTPDNDPRDFNGHGTHCAGNVAAINNNGYATASPSGGWNDGAQHPTANGVKVMALRIGWSWGRGWIELGYVGMGYAADAFVYAADNGAKIASCSWGSSNTGGLGDAIDYFLSKGGIIFKAAGNDDNENTDYMTDRSDIVSVAATDADDKKASFSSYGTWVDISAPGDNIMSLYHDHSDPENDYVATMSGTSMSTPLTASVAALIWSHDNSMSATDVKNRLFDTADDIDGLNPSYAGKLGAGRINAYKAVDFGSTPQPPAAPSDLTATSAGTSQIDLSWTDNSNNEDGFKIERKTGSGSFSQIATVGANVTTYSNTGLSSGTTYTYRVRAYNSVGNSDYSNEASATTDTEPTAPAAPSDLTATSAGTSQINLSWTDNSNNEDGFKIERKTGSGSFSQIATVGANVTTYSNTGLSSGTTYTYRVRAYNSVGNSDYSNEASATTDTEPTAPAAPSDLTATSAGTSQIDLSWTDNSNNEDGFKIERKTGSGSFSQIATVGANVTTYSNTGLSSGTTYTYRVRAYNSVGNSGYSNEASATTESVTEDKMHVQSVDVTKEAFFRWAHGKATVRVVDANNSPVADATVSGQWSGDASNTSEFQTDSDGYGTGTSDWVRNGSSFTFCVTNVSKSGWIYDENANVETCGSTNASSSVSKLSVGEVNMLELQEQTGESIHFSYPNPFNPSTTISFLLPEAAQVSVEIYNILGKKIATLMNEKTDAGFKTVVWDAHDFNGVEVGAGYYFYRVTVDNKPLYFQKILYLK